MIWIKRYTTQYFLKTKNTPYLCTIRDTLTILNGGPKWTEIQIESLLSIIICKKLIGYTYSNSITWDKNKLIVMHITITNSRFKK